MSATPHRHAHLPVAFAAVPCEFPSRDDVLQRLDEFGVQAVYSALGADRFLSDGPGNWKINSPLRDDAHPSFSIRKSDGVWIDRATGETGSIFDAVMQVRGGTFPEALAFVADEARVRPSGPPPPRRQASNSRRIVATYDYTDAAGNPLYQTVKKDPKGFMQRRPNGNGGWHWNLNSVCLVPYRLPDLLNTRPGDMVLVPEGEKDADRLSALGLVATTNPMGAGKWPDNFAAYLAGRHVVILPDNDDAGRKHSEQVAQSVAPIAASVKVVVLPGLPEKGDVSDWLDTGGSVDDLAALVAATAAWTPTKAPAPSDATDAAQSGPRLAVTRMTDVESRPVDWLWKGWLARGKVHIIGGHPGDGKSTLTTAIAAIRSNGGRWPDDSPAVIGNTLFLLAEDALDDVLRPRLDQHSANTDRVFAIESAIDGNGKHEPFSVAKHLALLEQSINEHAVELVVIDPLTSFLPNSDRNAEGDVRDLLTPLAQLAQRTQVAILCVMHVGKPTGTNRRPLQQLLGATAFGAVARIVWMVAPVPGDDPSRRVLAVAKSNLAMKPVALEWSRAEDAAITWHGESRHDLDELLSGAHSKRLDDAEGFLRDLLKDGPLLSKDIDATAAAHGYKPATIRRAKVSIGVESEKVGQGREAPWYSGLQGSDWETIRDLHAEQPTPSPQQPRLDAHPLLDQNEHLIVESDDNTEFPSVDAKMLTSNSNEHLVQRLDAQIEYVKNEHLIAARPTNACVDCGQPCGTARRCSPCAAAGVRRRA